jgi:hypothetical protein
MLLTLSRLELQSFSTTGILHSRKRKVVLEQWFQNHLKQSSKHRMQDPTIRASDSEGLPWSLRICISNKCPKDTDSDCLQNTLWESLSYGMKTGIWKHEWVSPNTEPQNYNVPNHYPQHGVLPLLKNIKHGKIQGNTCSLRATHSSCKK